VESGDGIALYLRNDIAYFEAAFGAGMLGIYPVPVNWHYTPDEANYLLTDSGVKLLLIHADLYEPIKQAIPAGLQGHHRRNPAGNPRGLRHIRDPSA
jgi:long-chain acyl-CoA synthetase